MDRPSLFERYFDWKTDLTEKHGFSFSVDYSAVYLGASESPGPRPGVGRHDPLLRAWDLVGRGTKDTGAFIWKVEHRHAYTDVAPGSFGFELGTSGSSNRRSRTRDPAHQPLLAAALGRRRFTLLGASSTPPTTSTSTPWPAHGPVSSTSPSPPERRPSPCRTTPPSVLRPAPCSPTILFLIGGLSDLNSDPTDPWQTVDSFSPTTSTSSIRDRLDASQDRIYLDNVHLTLWHADEREEAAQPSGWGANIPGPLHQREMAALCPGGLGRRRRQSDAEVGERRLRLPAQPRKNLLGFGLNWGQPNEDTWGPDLDNQYTAEVFYRWQISKALAITPDLEYLRNPALNPEEDSSGSSGCGPGWPCDARPTRFKIQDARSKIPQPPATVRDPPHPMSF